VTRGPVTRLGRKLDIVSLIFLAFGGALFIVAFLGMAKLRDLPEMQFVPGTVEAYEYLNRYFRLQKLSFLGIGMAVAGIGIGLSAAYHNRKLSNPASLNDQ
jgi:hypothetical protein